jgi:uncharacterized Zn-binding protein involved in type VI secretion
MKAIALNGHTHTCQGTKSSVHKNGPIQAAQTLVKVNGKPVAVVGDKITCDDTIDTVVTGSAIVKINGKPVARIGDKTAIGGFIDKGESLVKVE